MAFVYHRVPEDMNGTVLYPLSILKEQHLDMYLTRQKHHQFQPHVLEGSIPRLGCFWDDVLHFTALHPTHIAEALKAHGYSIKLKFYEIDANKLAAEKTMVYLNKPREKGAPTTFTDFSTFDSNEVEKWAHISDDATTHEVQSIPTADEFLLNYHAPYILFKGSLDISGAKVIEV